MRIQTECVPCLLKRVIFEAKQSTKDREVIDKVVKESCKLISKIYNSNVCSATIATKVHRLVYDILNDEDPFKNLKDASNRIAKALLPKARELIEKSIDPLRSSMICSIVGNLMDYGIEGASNKPEALLDIFEEYVKRDLGYDDCEKLKLLLLKSRYVLFFSDNCGEIVFDKILCEKIKEIYPNVHLTLVVKGVKILSDATIEDALDLGFDTIVDEILTTGSFAVGINFKKIPKKLKKALKDSDLIICKGMANYESFSETNYKPIAYLMHIKCNAIANSIGLPVGINVIKVYE